MIWLRLLFVCVMALGFSNCRKKTESAAKEIGEAGYSMTAEGWFSAVRDNDVAVMRKMVDGGFDTKAQDAEGNGALHVAANAGHEQAGEYLLNRGFSIDAKGAGGRTPLMTAVLADKPGMVKWLLRQGADPQQKDENGFKALMLAVSDGRRECVEELAPFHRDDLDAALLLASLIGQAEVIDALTNYGASVYARMEDGRTPLMLAAQNGHLEAAEMLIDIGASRFATMENGETAQSMAVAAGHADVAELIEKGFSSDLLALESDDEVAAALDGYLDDFQQEGEQGEEWAANDSGGTAPWNRPIPGEGGAGLLPEGSGSGEGRDFEVAGEALQGSAIGEETGGEALAGAALGGRREAAPSVSAEPLEGARIGKIERSDSQAEGVEGAEDANEDLPLVMRHYRQRELPVEVKRVSGGEASLRIAGNPTREVAVKAGETIPGSSLSVIRVFSRTEQGKLNDGAPIEVGMIEVEDTRSGRKMEWTEGRPATGHDPVALVEDAATGRRYVAKPGQKFTSEDGRGFVVSDVRPGQVVIEETATGEVRTLRLRGPKG